MPPDSPVDKKSISPHLIYAVVLIIVVVIFSALLYKAEKPGTLKLQLGDNKLEMTLEGDELSVKKMLDILFKDKEAKRESSALLKEFGDYYQPTDPSIVSALEKQNKESEVSKELRTLLYNLRGPFDRSTHSFYNVEDVHIVDAIEKLGFDHAVSKELREMLIYRRGPFQEKAKGIFISVPAGNRIKKGRAASCKGNEFFRREIRVFNVQRTNSVSVYVSGSFPCPETDSENPAEISKLVQLSYDDMKLLIGDSPVIGKESAFAEILIDAQ